MTLCGLVFSYRLFGNSAFSIFLFHEAKQLATEDRGSKLLPSVSPYMPIYTSS